MIPLRGLQNLQWSDEFLPPVVPVCGELIGFFLRLETELCNSEGKKQKTEKPSYRYLCGAGNVVNVAPVDV